MDIGIRVATVEVAHAEELREALGAAGIEARVEPVVPMTQVEVVRTNYRPMADVLVDGAREAEARSIVAAWESQGEAAAEAGAENPSPAEGGGGPAGAEAGERSRALGLAVLLGLGGLTILSVLLFGFDQAINVVAERYPAAFPIMGLLVMAAVMLLFRRRN